MIRFLFGVLIVFAVLGRADGFGERDRPMIDLLPEAVFPELKDLLGRSAEASPRMIEEALREMEVRGEAEAAGSRIYPSITGNLRYVGRVEERSDLNGHRTSGQPQAGLLLRQPLYHWGALRAESRAGRIREEIATHNRAEAYRLLALEIRSRYLDLVLQSRGIEVATAERDLLQEELRVSESLLERDEIALDAVRETRLAAEEASLRLDRLRRESEFSHAAFARLVGDETGFPESFPDVVPPLDTGYSGSEYRFGVLARREDGYRPGLETARQRALEAENRRDAERSRVRPNLNLVAGVTQDQVAVFDRSDIDRTVLFAGVEVRWNIFDGFEARGRRAAATARQRLEERRLDREERERAAGIERIESSLLFAERELKLAESRLELAGESLERKSGEFDEGRLSEKDLARARIEYMRTELAVIERRAEYLMMFAEYLSEAGFDPIMDSFAARTPNIEY